MAWPLAVLGPLAMSGALVGFRSEFAPPSAALVFVLVVLGVAILGGRWPGVTAAVLSAICFDFFFTRPYYSFVIDRHDDIEITVVLLVVALAVGELVERARRSERLATASRREVEQIRRVAEIASGGEPMTRLIDVVRREVVSVLGADSARFERPPFATTLPVVRHDRVTILSGGSEDEIPAGPRNEVALPVWGRGRELGRFVVALPHASIGTTIPQNDRLLAIVLVDQLGALLAAERDPRGNDGT